HSRPLTVCLAWGRVRPEMDPGSCERSCSSYGTLGRVAMDVRRPSFLGLFLLVLTLCGSTAILGVAPARADDVTDWNAIAIGVLALAGPDPVEMTRAMAMVHLAVHDALNAIDRRYEPYLYDARSEPGAAPGAAVAAAMRGVLVGALRRLRCPAPHA